MKDKSIFVCAVCDMSIGEGYDAVFNGEHFHLNCLVLNAKYVFANKRGNHESDWLFEIPISLKEKMWRMGSGKELQKWIDIVRKMPNADDRLVWSKDYRPMTLDGGSVHRFTLIEKLEKRITELNK